MNLVSGYELIDAGDERRLERFGGRLVDRPAPAVLEPRRDPEPWSRVDLRFERGRGWSSAVDPWTVDLAGLTLEVRATETGQLGVFPEHAVHWPWLEREVRARKAEPNVLNLFAYTGATTLALARAGARVSHVDATRTSVGWARGNAELSGLGDAPIRWLVDDALEFTRREVRRGRRYDGLILDPPSYGHGRGGRVWSIERDLPELLEACAAVATEDAFVLLTAHTTGLAPDDLAAAAETAFGRRAEPAELVLRATSGASLALGASARIITV
jgi:23S rRNA (cytosine1962-C5)-methyltransferase